MMTNNIEKKLSDELCHKLDSYIFNECERKSFNLWFGHSFGSDSYNACYANIRVFVEVRADNGDSNKR